MLQFRNKADISKKGDKELVRIMNSVPACRAYYFKCIMQENVEDLRAFVMAMFKTTPDQRLALWDEFEQNWIIKNN